MSGTKVCAVGLLLLFALSIAACCGGGTTKVESAPVNVSTTPTLGKQLEDLEAAYKKGAISKDEYDSARKKLIEQGTPK